MNLNSWALREQAVQLLQQEPGIVHHSSGVRFYLGIDEAIVLSEILQEQEQFCGDTLGPDRPMMPTSEDASLQYMYDKVLPQIEVSQDALRAMREDLDTKIALFDGAQRHVYNGVDSDDDVIEFEPTRLQAAFLMQAIEWMDICLDEGLVVDIARLRISKKFAFVQKAPMFELNFWLTAEYIDKHFGLIRPARI